MASKSSGESQIVGYKYYMSIHMGIARGPINELIEIKAGDLTAWSGAANANEYYQINVPMLFGGDEKEGGLVGPFKLYLGGASQVVDAQHQTEMGSPQPGWRGVSSLYYQGLICSNNPYPKVWKLRVRRTTAGWDGDNPWYPERAAVSTGWQVIYSFYQNPLPGDTITINEYVITFTSTPSTGPTQVHIGPDLNHTTERLSQQFNGQPQDYPLVVGSHIDSKDGTRRVIVDMSASSTATGIPDRVAAGNESSIVAMNGAHIIYESVTNTVWGRGLPAVMIDENSFIKAADTLWDEQFGLCIRWNRQEEIDKFISTIVAHIGAALFLDRRTGLLTLNLIRANYVAEELPLFTFQNGILEITEDQSSSNETAYNEIIVKFTDPTTGKVGSIRAQNLASFQSLGVLISTTVEYLGLPTAGLAARIAQRDLEMNSSSIRRMTVKMDRAGWAIAPGDVFRISVPSRGIAQMVLRAGDIEDAPLEDGTITIHALQDIFGLPSDSFVKPQPPGWRPPDNMPWVIYERDVDEMTYYDLANVLPAAELAAVQFDTGWIKIYADQPKENTIEYDVASRVAGEAAFVSRNRAGFDATALLIDDIGLYDTTMTIDAGKNMHQVRPGQIAHVGEEYVGIVSLAGGNAFNILRGVIDTHVQPHGAGERVWFQTAMPTTDFRDYANAETVEVKLLSRSSSQVLDPALAPTDPIEIRIRQGRPYPGANLRIAGIPFELSQAAIADDQVFTWSHRDRLTQGNFLLGYGEPSTGPEAGVTYQFRVYDEAGSVLLRTVTGIAGDTWTYTAAMHAADGTASTLRFHFESIRGGITSWLVHNFIITLLPLRITEAGDTRGTEDGVDTRRAE